MLGTTLINHIAFVCCEDASLAVGRQRTWITSLCEMYVVMSRAVRTEFDNRIDPVV